MTEQVFNCQRRKYTILQADGLYPVRCFDWGWTKLFGHTLTRYCRQDDLVEQRTFAPRDAEDYEVHYVQANLIPPGAASAKPWSTIDKELRDRVDGIMVLKAYFTAADLELFPRLKV